MTRRSITHLTIEIIIRIITYIPAAIFTVMFIDSTREFIAFCLFGFYFIGYILFWRPYSDPLKNKDWEN